MAITSSPDVTSSATDDRVRSARAMSAAGLPVNPPTLVRLDGTGRVVMKNATLSIGRSARRCDIAIEDRSISAVHCELYFQDDELHVRDLSRHGTQVNGSPVSNAPLREGDVLSVLNHRFRIVLDPDNFIALPFLDEGDWLVQMAGMLLGPMPWSELQEMARRGALQLDDQLLTAKSSWQRVADVKELASECQLVDDGAQFNEVDLKSDSPHETGPDINSGPQLEALDDKGCIDDSIHGSTSVDAAALEADVDGLKYSQFSSVASVDANHDSDSGDSDVDSLDSPVQSERPMGAALQETAVGTGTLPDVNLGLPRAESRQNRPMSTVEPAGDGDEPSSPVDLTSPTVAPGWFYRRNDIELGPVRLSELREMAASGLLGPLDAVRPTESEDWLSASSVIDHFTNETDSAGRSFDEAALSDLDSQISPPASSRPVPAPLPVPPDPVVAPTITPIPPPTSRQRFSSPVSELAESISGLAGRTLAGIIVHRWISLAVCVAGMVAALSYFFANGYQGTRVYGQLTLDGEPVENVQITFNSLDQGWGSTAVTNENGDYEFATEDGGLKPGSYVVNIWPETDPPEVQAALQRLYRGSGESALNGTGDGHVSNPDSDAETDEEHETTDGGPIDLPPGTIPLKYRSASTSGLKASIRAGESNINLILRSKGEDLVLKNDEE